MTAKATKDEDALDELDNIENNYRDYSPEQIMSGFYMRQSSPSYLAMLVSDISGLWSHLLKIFYLI